MTDIVFTIETKDLIDARLESPVVVKVFSNIAFVTWSNNGVQKRIQTNRRGLELIRDTINASLANPLSNENGRTVRP